LWTDGQTGGHLRPTEVIRLTPPSRPNNFRSSPIPERQPQHSLGGINSLQAEFCACGIFTGKSVTAMYNLCPLSSIHQVYFTDLWKGST